MCPDAPLGLAASPDHSALPNRLEEIEPRRSAASRAAAAVAPPLHPVRRRARAELCPAASVLGAVVLAGVDRGDEKCATDGCCAAPLTLASSPDRTALPNRLEETEPPHVHARVLQVGAEHPAHGS